MIIITRQPPTSIRRYEFLKKRLYVFSVRCIVTQKAMLTSAQSIASIDILIAFSTLNTGMLSMIKNSFLTSKDAASPFATKALMTHGIKAV